MSLRKWLSPTVTTLSRWKRYECRGNPRCLCLVSSGVVLQSCRELPEREQHFLLFVFDDSCGNRCSQASMRVFASLLVAWYHPRNSQTSGLHACEKLSRGCAHPVDVKLQILAKSAFTYLRVCQSAGGVRFTKRYLFHKIDFVFPSSKERRCNICFFSFLLYCLS